MTGFTNRQARDLYAPKDMISKLMPLRERPGKHGVSE